MAPGGRTPPLLLGLLLLAASRAAEEGLVPEEGGNATTALAPAPTAKDKLGHTGLAAEFDDTLASYFPKHEESAVVNSGRSFNDTLRESGSQGILVVARAGGKAVADYEEDDDHEFGSEIEDATAAPQVPPQHQDVSSSAAKNDKSGSSPAAVAVAAVDAANAAIAAATHTGAGAEELEKEQQPKEEHPFLSHLFHDKKNERKKKHRNRSHSPWVMDSDDDAYHMLATHGDSPVPPEPPPPSQRQREEGTTTADVQDDDSLPKLVDQYNNVYILSSAKTAIAMQLADDPQFFQDITLLFLAATALGMIVLVLRLPPLLGFLLAGAVVGPGGFGLIEEIVQVETTGGIGVILIMFGLGLEFDAHGQLRSGLGNVCVLGGLSIIAAIVAIFAIGGWATGGLAIQGLFVGIVVSMSSTSVAIKCLESQALDGMDSISSKVSIGILILQDFCVGIIFAFLPFLLNLTKMYKLAAAHASAPTADVGSAPSTSAFATLATILLKFAAFLVSSALLSRFVIPYIYAKAVAAQKAACGGGAASDFAVRVQHEEETSSRPFSTPRMAIAPWQAASQQQRVAPTTNAGAHLSDASSSQQHDKQRSHTVPPASTMALPTAMPDVFGACAKRRSRVTQATATKAALNRRTSSESSAAAGILGSAPQKRPFFFDAPPPPPPSIPPAPTSHHRRPTMMSPRAPPAIATATPRFTDFDADASAESQIDEIAHLATLAICFGLSLVSHKLGLSSELGAFVAGLCISSALRSSEEVKHILQKRLAMLRDLFATLFLATIGMFLNWRFLLHSLELFLAMAAAVLLIKFSVTSLVVRAFGLSASDAAAVGLALCQVGEFSFILIVRGKQILGRSYYLLLLGITPITLVFTPLSFWVRSGLCALYRRRQQRKAREGRAGVPHIELGRASSTM